jgi:hypothetical protein
MSEDQTGAPKVTVKAVPVRIFGSEDAEITRTVRNAAGGKVISLSRDSGVTSANGFQLAAGAEVRVVLRPGESLWGVCAAATETNLEVI